MTSRSAFDVSKQHLGISISHIIFIVNDSFQTVFTEYLNCNLKMLGKLSANIKENKKIYLTLICTRKFDMHKTVNNEKLNYLFELIAYSS